MCREVAVLLLCGFAIETITAGRIYMYIGFAQRNFVMPQGLRYVFPCTHVTITYVSIISLGATFYGVTVRRKPNFSGRG